MKKTEQSQATKAKMATALLQMLKTQPLESIKIRAITEQSGVDRQTFYYHFTDIYALLEYAVGLTLIPLLREMSQTLTIEDELDRIIEFFVDNRYALKTVLDSGGRICLYRSLYGEVAQTVRHFLGPLLESSGVSEERADEALRVGQSIVVSLVLNWVQGYFKGEPCELKESVATLARDYVYGVCHRPQKQEVW